MSALFLAVAVGCWIGKIRIGNFSLGGMAGAITESACIETAGEALQHLGLEAEKLKALQANIGVTCAITYLFGMLTVIFFASRVAPLLMGLTEACGGLSDQIN